MFRFLPSAMALVCLVLAAGPAAAWSTRPEMNQQYGGSRFSDPDESAERFGGRSSEGTSSPTGRDGGGWSFSFGQRPSEGGTMSLFPRTVSPSSDGPGWRGRDDR